MQRSLKHPSKAVLTIFHEYAAGVAGILNNLATLHSDTERLEDAEKENTEVIEMCDTNMALHPVKNTSIRESAIQLRSDIKVKKNQQALNDSWASEHKQGLNA